MALMFYVGRPVDVTLCAFHSVQTMWMDALERLSLDGRRVIGFACTTLHDWLKNTRHLFHPVRSFHWFIKLSVPFVSDWVECRRLYSLWFYNTRFENCLIENYSLLQKLKQQCITFVCSQQENLELGEKRKQQELLQQVSIVLPRNLCFLPNYRQETCAKFLCYVVNCFYNWDVTKLGRVRL